MSVGYGRRPKIFDHFEYFNQNVWSVEGDTAGTVEFNDSVMKITNTTGVPTAFLGVVTIDTFPVGSSISASVKSSEGRHHALVGFGELPPAPYPHGETTKGCTWYARADNQTSTLSIHDENDYTTYINVSDMTQSFNIVRMTRKSQSEVEFYLNGEHIHTFSGILLANDYKFYFTADGYYNPNSVEVDWVSIT